MLINFKANTQLDGGRKSTVAIEHDLSVNNSVIDLYTSFNAFLLMLGYSKEELLLSDNTSLDDEEPYIPEDCQGDCNMCNLMAQCDLGLLELELKQTQVRKENKVDNDKVTKEEHSKYMDRIKEHLNNPEYVDEFRNKIATDDKLVVDVLSVYLKDLYSNVMN